MTRTSRRQFLALGAGMSVLGGRAGAVLRQTGPTVRGEVVQSTGQAAPGAEVVAVNSAVTDEDLKQGFGDYRDDSDRADLNAARVQTDTRGQFRLDVSGVEPPRRLVAIWEDDDGETWFSPLRERPSRLVLANHLLFGPRTVQSGTHRTGVIDPVPTYGGTVTLWRHVEPGAPGSQRLHIEVTETASGEVDPVSGDRLEIRPWELTLDRQNARYGTDELNLYQKPSIENGLFSFTVPERVDSGDVDVDYDNISLAEATGLTTYGGYDVERGTTRETLTKWHPARTPQVPAYTEGAAREAFSAVDLEQRLENEDAANTWLNVIGTLGAAVIGGVVGAATGGIGTGVAMSAVGLVAEETDIIEIDTGSQPGEPGTVVGERIEESARPSKNTHDSIDRLWVDPPSGWLPSPTAASVVVTLPYTVEAEDGTGEFVCEALWTAGGASTKFGRRVSLGRPAGQESRSDGPAYTVAEYTLCSRIENPDHLEGHDHDHSHECLDERSTFSLEETAHIRVDFEDVEPLQVEYTWRTPSGRTVDGTVAVQPPEEGSRWDTYAVWAWVELSSYSETGTWRVTVTVAGNREIDRTFRVVA